MDSAADHLGQRIGDEARDNAVDALRAHLAAGRLSPDEFDERLAQVRPAKTQADLDALFTDLPANPDAVAGVSFWQAPRPKRPAASHPLRIAQRWMIILAPVLWLVVFTGWGYWWLVYVAWAAIFLALNRAEKVLLPSDDPAALTA